MQRLRGEHFHLRAPPHGDAHLSLKAFKPDDVLVGGRVLLAKVFSEGMDLQGELSLNFGRLQPEETFRVDSEVVQRESVKTFLPFVSQASYTL